MIKFLRSLPLITLSLFMASVFISCDGDNSSSPGTHYAGTWVSGSNMVNQAGVYGEKGTPAPSNIPGARTDSVSWADTDGNLWLFGGHCHDGTDYFRINDLWKYNTSTNQWTWVSGSNTSHEVGVYGTKGTADAANVPGARNSSVSWIDKDGNLWLFGGYGYVSGDDGYLNDLWKYDTDSCMWTWVSGPDTVEQIGDYGTQGIAASSNVPGARLGSVSWTDTEGNLWLFGGYCHVGISSSMINDLWKYNPIENQWTWVSGSNTVNQAGVYGEKGTAASSNVPGARTDSVSWADADGNLWLFGGQGCDSADNGYLNDLWKYDTESGEWTWVSGSDTVNQAGVYGEKGIADTANIPCARSRSVSWIDKDGNLWLFGGYCYDGTDYFRINDLWKYDPASNEWTWVSGSNIINQAGEYGEKGTADAANIPGARIDSVSWTDTEGNLWLFGGSGYDSVDFGFLNDLWKFDIL